ncbi:hypothetical protein RUM43_001463 [Polyplax serrata]|uniref:Uncharacterized protein n=1 Tax=Polyplax serrata TaxID=468196 RepID=A0AAN8SHU0_POLSC
MTAVIFQTKFYLDLVRNDYRKSSQLRKERKKGRKNGKRQNQSAINYPTKLEEVPSQTLQKEFNLISLPGMTE